MTMTVSVHDWTVGGLIAFQVLCLAYAVVAHRAARRATRLYESQQDGYGEALRALGWDH